MLYHLCNVFSYALLEGVHSVLWKRLPHPCTHLFNIFFFHIKETINRVYPICLVWSLGIQYSVAFNDSSLVIPYVTTKRDVLWRERFAGMYARCNAPWAYGVGQVIFFFSRISPLECTLLTLIFHNLNIQTSTIKFFSSKMVNWFFRWQLKFLTSWSYHLYM